MDKNAVEAAVMRRFLKHLDTRKDAQNIDLMTLAGFCRNCLGKWYKAAATEQGASISDEAAREWSYGMSYGDWKSQYQLPSSEHQMALFNQQQGLQKDMTAFRLQLASSTVLFSDTLALVEKWYDLYPTSFKNGLDAEAVENAIGTNEGSLKVFALGRLNGFTPEQSLASFGEHFRDVENTPDGQDHQNIRQFIRHGWAGVQFENVPLTLKAPSV
ncbi:MAG: hypothetical protein ACJA0E_000391 [Bermanella sp.]|jgi:hypothetical protein